MSVLSLFADLTGITHTRNPAVWPTGDKKIYLPFLIRFHPVGSIFHSHFISATSLSAGIKCAAIECAGKLGGSATEGCPTGGEVAVIRSMRGWSTYPAIICES